MTAGQIVTVDWRDAVAGSGEPNKIRPAIVVGAHQIFGTGLPFQLVVPLTGDAALAIPGVSLRIEPGDGNGCRKRSYALAWNVQAVPNSRLTETPSHVTASELATIRAHVVTCVTG